MGNAIARERYWLARNQPTVFGEAVAIVNVNNHTYMHSKTSDNRSPVIYIKVVLQTTLLNLNMSVLFV